MAMENVGGEEEEGQGEGGGGGCGERTGREIGRGGRRLLKNFKQKHHSENNVHT